MAIVSRILKGGPGSGNFGHAGRPGEVGGSTAHSELVASANSLVERQFLGIERPDGTPYVGHVRRVADEFEDPREKIMALLHDSVEEGKMTLAEVREKYGGRIARGVDSISRRSGETYTEFIERVARNPDASRIKLADLRDNLKNVDVYKPLLRPRYERAVERLTEYLKRRAAKPVSISKSGKREQMIRLFVEVHSARVSCQCGICKDTKGAALSESSGVPDEPAIIETAAKIARWFSGLKSRVMDAVQRVVENPARARLAVKAARVTGISSATILKGMTPLWKGGQGSGNYGHAGRPGEVGGSEKSGEKTFEYRSPYRPVISISASLPKDWQSTGERSFTVNKPLSRSLIANLQLEPQDPNDPINLKASYEDFHQKVMNEYVNREAVSFKLKDGSTLILSPYVSEDADKYPFRVTRILETGTPSGHEVFTDFSEATLYLNNFRKDIVDPALSKAMLVKAELSPDDIELAMELAFGPNPELLEGELARERILASIEGYKAGEKEALDFLEATYVQPQIATEIREALLTDVLTFSRDTLERINSSIRDELLAGVSMGEDVVSLGSRIGDVFEQLQQFEANRIARTEYARAQIKGKARTVEDDGYTIGQIIASPAACPICLTYHGRYYSISDIEDHFPFHPNCRCNFEPVDQLPDGIELEDYPPYSVFDEEFQGPGIPLTAEELDARDVQRAASDEEVAAQIAEVGGESFKKSASQEIKPLERLRLKIAALGKDADFEAKHPRASDGKFSSTDSGPATLWDALNTEGGVKWMVENRKQWIADYLVIATANKSTRDVVDGMRVKRNAGGTYDVYYMRQKSQSGIAAEDVYENVRRGPLGILTQEADSLRVEAVMEWQRKHPDSKIGKSTGKLGCIMARMITSDAAKVVEWTKANVPESELAGDGIEHETHCTIFYGLDPEVKSGDVEKFLADQKPITLVLGRISRFKDDGTKGYDVLKIEAVSPDAELLNTKIRKHFGEPGAGAVKTFSPHITLAYIKPGALKELDGNARFDGEIYVFDSLVFSTPESKVKTEIALGKNGNLSKGGPGSGFHGHAGRPGMVGGSSTDKQLDALDREIATAKSPKDITGKDSGLLFHGTIADRILGKFDLSRANWGVASNPFSQGSKGIYLTNDVQAARYFARKSGEFHATTKEGMASILKPDGSYDGQEANDLRWGKLFGDKDGNIIAAKLKDGVRIKEFTGKNYPTEKMAAEAKKEGYGGISFRESGLDYVQDYPSKHLGNSAYGSRTTFVFNPDDVEIVRNLGDLNQKMVSKGGPTSGNYNHAGRPGQVGGSAPGEGGRSEKQDANSIAVSIHDYYESKLSDLQNRLTENHKKRVEYFARNVGSSNPVPESKAEISDLIKESTELLDEANALRAERNEKIMASIRVKNPAKIEFAVSGNFESDSRMAIKRGINFVESITDKELIPVGKEVEFNTATITRARCGSEGGMPNIEMPIGSPVSSATAAHELGHAIEAMNSNVHKAAVEFLFRRIDGESGIPLPQLRPDGGYENHEITAKDKFLDPYSGKLYVMEVGPNWKMRMITGSDFAGKPVSTLWPPTEATPGRIVTATEVLSMGIQHLMEDPGYFAKADPDHFSFTVNTLQGKFK